MLNILNANTFGMVVDVLFKCLMLDAFGTMFRVCTFSDCVLIYFVVRTIVWCEFKFIENILPSVIVISFTVETSHLVIFLFVCE